jgi:hypothetical protein
LSPQNQLYYPFKNNIFRIQISKKDNEQKNWLNHPNTNSKLRLHGMTVTISNSISSSGNVVVAGYILLEHLEFMQKKLLPAQTTTPYFDIAFDCQASDGSNNTSSACGKMRGEPYSWTAKS